MRVLIETAVPTDSSTHTIFFRSFPDTSDTFTTESSARATMVFPIRASHHRLFAPHGRFSVSQGQRI
jgi:hypothetical protein